MGQSLADLLIKYDVRFELEKGGTGTHARGGGLANLLEDLQDPESLEEGIASADWYLEGKPFNYENNTVSSEMYTAWLDHTTADIFPGIGDTELLLQAIPLSDFKEILIGWRLFVLDHSREV